MTWAVLTRRQSGSLRYLAVGAWLATNILGTGEMERTRASLLGEPLAKAIQPCGVTLFVIWLASWYDRFPLETTMSYPATAIAPSLNSPPSTRYAARASGRSV